MNLTDDEIRIKIAEFCKIQTYPKHDFEHCDGPYYKCFKCGTTEPYWNFRNNKEPCCGTTNNYPESLDAMFEAEECLTEQQLEKMFGIMCDKLASEDDLDPRRKLIFHSDARFRATCFLETIK